MKKKKKKKTVKILNTNIFHKKAKKKKRQRKYSHETCWSLLQTVKGTLSLQHRSTLIIFSLKYISSWWLALLYSCSTKAIFQGVRAGELPCTQSGLVCFLVYHGHRITSTIPAFTAREGKARLGETGAQGGGWIERQTSSTSKSYPSYHPMPQH